MVHKILIIKSACRNTRTCEYNKGSFAVVSTTIETLKKYIPDADISTFIQISKENSVYKKVKVIENPVFETKYYSLVNSLIMDFNLLKCVTWNFFYRLGLNFNFLINSKYIRHFKEADLVVDLSLDAYSDDYGIRSIIETSKEILIPVYLKRPTIIYAQSLGPFKKPFNRFIAKFTLSRVSLISAREELSYENVIELGIDENKVRQTADQAFLLEPIKREEAFKLIETEDKNKHFDKTKPTFGFAISMMKTANDKGSSLKKLMMLAYSSFQYIVPDRLGLFIQNTIKNSSFFSKFVAKNLDFTWVNTVIEHLIDKYDANIILVPHIISQQYELFGDDRTAINLIYRQLSEKSKSRVVPVQEDYSSSEVKGIIGLCDIFIGEKMHANVGATSQSIPTIGLAYSHKFFGIMKMLGQEKYVLQSINEKKLILTIDEVWENRDNISSSISEKLPNIKLMAEENGKLAAGLLV
ncbi:polysaccharide pyruvyl transferase family protein [Methanolobus sp. WCC1]|uniref:polysaccharide pyruvyl transferase family protein n=1 Tax=unclassified Methanolobus TaxID=2629569 RepID=UPI00324487E6